MSQDATNQEKEFDTTKRGRFGFPEINYASEKTESQNSIVKQIKQKLTDKEQDDESSQWFV